MELKFFINEYVKALRSKSASVFVGAGLSYKCGGKLWWELLEPFAEELSLDIKKESENLVQIAQYTNNRDRNKHRLCQSIKDSFEKLKISQNHKLLAELPIDKYWTTNYDDLIEEGLKSVKRICDEKIDNSGFSYVKKKRDAIVYKLHGDKNKIDEIVLTRDDYEKYEQTHSNFVTALQGELVSNTILFLGYSFNDPDINNILSRVRYAMKGSNKTHYIIIKKIEKNECLSDDDFVYKKIKQDLKEEDYKNYGIQTIFIDNYDEITKILLDIKKQYKAQTIFISGSASEYGHFGKERGQDLIYDLTKNLLNYNFKLISGHGLGIGDYILSAYSDIIAEKGEELVKDSLTILPFPRKYFGTLDDASKNDAKQSYRKRLINSAGIAIFAFGNKDKSGKNVNADGLEEEFNLAVENGCYPIPIGTTGYMAEDLYKKVKSDMKKYFGSATDCIKEYFNKLDDNTLSNIEIVNLVSTIVNLLAFKTMD